MLSWDPRSATPSGANPANISPVPYLALRPSRLGRGLEVATHMPRYGRLHLKYRLSLNPFERPDLFFPLFTVERSGGCRGPDGDGGDAVQPRGARPLRPWLGARHGDPEHPAPGVAGNRVQQRPREGRPHRPPETPPRAGLPPARVASTPTHPGPRLPVPAASQRALERRGIQSGRPSPALRRPASPWKPYRLRGESLAV